MRIVLIAPVWIAALLSWPAGSAVAGTWTRLTNAASFGATTPLLLTDGTIMVQDIGGGAGSGNWWKLTPDETGSYVNGTGRSSPPCRADIARYISPPPYCRTAR